MTGVSPERLASLIEGAVAVTANADLTQLLFAAAETARDTTGARYAAMGVIGEHGTLIEFLHVGLEPGTAEAIGHPPVGKGVLGTLIRSAKTIRLDRIEDHPDSTGFPPNHPRMETFLGVPVRVGERVFGNLYLTEKPGGFTEEDQHLVEALAVIAGAAISNSRMQQRMRRLAVVDDRERIARDLHDAIIQDIFAVGLLLQGLALRTEDDRERIDLEDAVTRLDRAIATLSSAGAATVNTFSIRALGPPSPSGVRHTRGVLCPPCRPDRRKDHWANRRDSLRLHLRSNPAG